jgi:hypothetical protein
MCKNPYHNLLAEDLTAVINNTIFDKDIDKEIAINKFVFSMSVEKCAEKIGYETKSVQRRLPGVKERIDWTLELMNKKNQPS